MSKRKLIAIIVLSVSFSIFALIGTTYALFTRNIKGEKTVSINSGAFKIEFQEGDTIHLDNLRPVSDEEGLLSSPYTFTIKNTGNLEAYYTISFQEDTKENTLDNKYVKYNLTNDKGYNSSVKTVNTVGSGTFVIKDEEALGVDNSNNTVTYTLRLWLSNTADNSAQGKTYKAKILVKGYSEKGLAEKEKTAVDVLLSNYTNDESIQDYNVFYKKEDINEKENKMYVFDYGSNKGTQQEDWTNDEMKTYRYIGKNPNNYVTFNEEVAGWRIVGIETVDDGTGRKEKRIKLVRNTAFTGISFDNKPSETGTSESENGSNNWTDSRLMMLLNPNYENNPLAIGGSLYWNRQSGNSPVGKNNAVNERDFLSSGLTSDAKEMIGDAKWYLGGDGYYTNIAIPRIYKKERGEETCTTTENCTTQRPINWIGKVGLIYLSDYGYATSGGSVTKRDKCLDTYIYSWDASTNNTRECPNNDWLFTNKSQFTITPNSRSSSSILGVDQTGKLYSPYAYNTSIEIRPVVYLKADVRYKSGNGSKGDPFKFDYTNATNSSNNPKTGVEKFLYRHANPETIQNYQLSNVAQKKKMYVFHHGKGSQQSDWTNDELTSYRYIGKNPNNYVTFNGEEAGWRIIGVFTVDDGTGRREKRVKLIRNNSFNYISYDNKSSGTGSSEDTENSGSNDWTDSRLMMLLNPNYEGNPLAIGGSLYWNRQKGKCPVGESDAKGECDFTKTGLTKDAKDLIGNALWYLGGDGYYSDSYVSQTYLKERGEETCTTTENCTQKRPINWTGKVGLMYYSDYGYATSGGSVMNQDACLNTYTYSWDTNSKEAENCPNNSWLFNNKMEYTITPDSNRKSSVLCVNNDGKLCSVYTWSYGSILRPVVYLVPDIKLLSGTGSKSDPFVFGK